jgi:hypothetical protein
MNGRRLSYFKASTISTLVRTFVGSVAKRKRFAERRTRSPHPSAGERGQAVCPAALADDGVYKMSTHGTWMEATAVILQLLSSTKVTCARSAESSIIGTSTFTFTIRVVYNPPVAESRIVSFKLRTLRALGVPAVLPTVAVLSLCAGILFWRNGGSQLLN